MGLRYIDYFISCVSAYVEWKIGSVFAVAQAWLISKQVGRVCWSVLQMLGVGFDWRDWGSNLQLRRYMNAAPNWLWVLKNSPRQGNYDKLKLRIQM